MYARLTLRSLIAGFGLGVALSVSSVHADEVEFLEPLIEEIGEGALPHESVARCAGLFVAVYEWVGEARLGAENSESLKNTVAALLELASRARQDALIESSDLSAAAIDTGVRENADNYLRHIQGLHSVSGQMLFADAVIGSDIQTCQALLVGAVQNG